MGMHTLAKTILEHFEHPAERFFNRELSWLEFNTRVLQEAGNPEHPLLERLRFLSISASNLDEFYMVRVAGLRDQVREGLHKRSLDGLTAREQLEKIHQKVMRLLAGQEEQWNILRQPLQVEGLSVLSMADLKPQEKRWLGKFFQQEIFPVLTPIALDPAHPFPFLANQSQTLILELHEQEQKKQQLAVVPLPQKLSRFIALPRRNGQSRYIPLEEVVCHSLPLLFPGYEVLAKGMFRILRDSDLDIEDDADDLVRGFEKAVKERKRGHVIRLQVDAEMPGFLRDYVVRQLHAEDEAQFVSHGIMDMRSLSELVADEHCSQLRFEPYIPRFPERINDFNGDCLAAIYAKDIVVHHPFESFDVVVRFLQQAARDPDVLSIKQTLYRTSNDSPIIAALVEAAEAGKAVTAIVEIRARFDEEANMKWARDLERAGAQVVYGVVGLKTHAKMSLVTQRTPEGLRSYAHLGTGNYHPVTAKVYTDLSYFTCDATICQEVARLFNYLTGYALPRQCRKITMSPLHMRDELIRHIEMETSHAKAGRPAQIWAKMNSLTDEETIDALYAAGQAGVQVVLIVRGICALRPGIAGFSENITVKSIIGRFLEHSRIFCFGNGHGLPSLESRVFISSADWMFRNFDHRVEYMVEIDNPTVHEQIVGQIMVATVEDTRHSWFLLPDGHYERKLGELGQFSSHEYFMRNPSLSGRGRALKRTLRKPQKLAELRPNAKKQPIGKEELRRD